MKKALRRPLRGEARCPGKKARTCIVDDDFGTIHAAKLAVDCVDKSSLRSETLVEGVAHAAHRPDRIGLASAPDRLSKPPDMNIDCTLAEMKVRPHPGSGSWARL